MHIYQLVMRVVETFAPILGMFVIFFLLLYERRVFNDIIEHIYYIYQRSHFQD